MERTTNYISHNLFARNIVNASWIIALNSARLHSLGVTPRFEKYLSPLCSQILGYNSLDANRILPINKSKLYLSLQYLNELVPNSTSTVIDKIINELDEYFKKEENNSLISSRKEKNCCKILDSARIKYETQKKIMAYHVDIYIEPNIVIEVLGKVHKFSNTELWDAITLMKLDLLRRKGYEVCEILKNDDYKTKLLRFIKK